MRHHHDGLVEEMLETDKPNAFNNVKKARFSAYVAFWFTGLAGTIERYEQLRNTKAIPENEVIDALLTEKFKDVLKPFRNSVAHCSDHDDPRTLQLLEHEHWIPDHATAVAEAFHAYFAQHRRAKT